MRRVAAEYCSQLLFHIYPKSDRVRFGTDMKETLTEGVRSFGIWFHIGDALRAQAIHRLRHPIETVSSDRREVIAGALANLNAQHYSGRTLAFAIVLSILLFSIIHPIQ